MDISTVNWPFVQVAPRFDFRREENAWVIADGGPKKVWAFSCNRKGNRPIGQIERRIGRAQNGKEDFEEGDQDGTEEVVDAHDPRWQVSA
jgi:hypothetical protein